MSDHLVRRHYGSKEAAHLSIAYIPWQTSTFPEQRYEVLTRIHNFGCNDKIVKHSTLKLFDQVKFST